jgi:DNA ligase (NAD+)
MSIERIKYLVSYLNDCTVAYDKGTPKISDKEWDNLYFELLSLENNYNYRCEDSPTQTIYFKTVSELKKVTHNHPMLSLEKTKSLDTVQSFIGNKEIIAMCKMDGLTCSLTYKNGHLISAETRGNGIVGEDILHNAMVIPSIPKIIPYREDLTVDGEIICVSRVFEKFASIYKNPRNFASGSIRLLDSKECAERGLTFIAWDVITSLYFNNGKEYSVSDKLNYISDFGFLSVPKVVAPAQDADGNNVEIDDIVEHLTYQAKELGFPIDGIVFKFNNCAYGRSLGETMHHFKNALAYKFYDETYWTRLLDIEWTMGRTGVLTPVAIFEPIDVDGSTIERASLHNCSIISELFGVSGPHKHQEVEVFKANMIIPQIKSVKSEDLYIENKIEEPVVCPVCGGEVTHKITIDSMTLVCANPACPGKLINRLDHFCGKKGLDMKGISKATLEKLIDWGWIENISDLFTLSTHKKEWINKAGFGIKSVEKILDAIEQSKQCNLTQFICALGIPLIGAVASKELTKHFTNWDDFISAVKNKFEFYSFSNFGMEMNNAIVNYDYSEAEKIVNNYIKFTTENSNTSITTSSQESLIAGKSFVITGKLTHYKNRNELKSLIESLGGKVVDSVSKNTCCLINNDVNSTSSKNLKAQSLGIPILSEKDFIQNFHIE